ncbi:MAG: PCRF domain-containing protein, partial [Chloroflexaceae bacterium]|nr:PCRF domain-containing protein [Chloroflexaceae bacterium]
MRELTTELETLRERLQLIQAGLNLPVKQAEIATLEERAADPDLWNDQREAQRVMQTMTRLKEDVEAWQQLDTQLTHVTELVELAVAEDDESLRDETLHELDAVRDRIDRLELSLLLNGKYDDRDAFLSIQAGMGGTDAQDWAEMMLRMYLRWAEARGYTSNVVDHKPPATRRAFKSATLELRGQCVWLYQRPRWG